MASIVVNGDTSGAVTLSAPAVAGTVTVTLPTTTGTMLTTASSTGVSGSAISSGTLESYDMARSTSSSFGSVLLILELFFFCNLTSSG